MVLSSGQCKEIESAYDEPEDIVSERLSRVFNLPACRECPLAVFAERGCAGESANITLSACERTECKDGTIRSWAGSGSDDQAVSYQLNCA
jgi:hypothetical protein